MVLLSFCENLVDGAFLLTRMRGRHKPLCAALLLLAVIAFARSDIHVLATPPAQTTLQIIFDPRELYLHETAEETSFNFGVFFVQFAVHLLGGPVGFLLYFLTRRSDAIACGMTQGTWRAAASLLLAPPLTAPGPAKMAAAAAP